MYMYVDEDVMKMCPKLDLHPWCYGGRMGVQSVHIHTYTCAYMYIHTNVQNWSRIHGVMEGEWGHMMMMMMMIVDDDDDI